MVRIKFPWLIFAFALMSASRCSQAQPLSFGLQGNLNAAKFVWNENTNAGINEKIGLGGGIYAGYRINRLVSLRGGLSMTQKGAEVVQAYTQADTLTGIYFDHYNTSDTRLNYIEFPLLISFSLPASNRARVNAHFGFYGSLLLSGKQVVIASASSGSLQMDSVSTISAEAFRQNDYGLVVGGAIPMGRLEIGGSYSLGFPRVLKSDDVGINQFVDHRNRVLSFTIGYKIK